MTTAERRELRDDLKGEIEEIDADLIGAYEELKEIRERIAELKATRARLKAERDALRPMKA